MTDWIEYTPQKEGEAPQDWVGVDYMEAEFWNGAAIGWSAASSPVWSVDRKYRYRARSPNADGWKDHVPTFTGEKPADWDGGTVECYIDKEWVKVHILQWYKGSRYRYTPGEWVEYVPSVTRKVPEDWDGGPVETLIDDEWKRINSPRWWSKTLYRYKRKKSEVSELAQRIHELSEEDAVKLADELEELKRDWADKLAEEMMLLPIWEWGGEEQVKGLARLLRRECLPKVG